MFKKLTMLIVVAVLCPFFGAFAQIPVPVTPVSPLVLGRKVPESFWTSSHSFFIGGKKTSADLMRYKGKFLILDFWASWCGSCTKKFPFLDSLQKRNAGRLNVLLVNSPVGTGDSLVQVASRMEKVRAQFGFSLPTLIEDTLLFALFPHDQIPHYVWIDGTGRVVALTGSDPLNDRSIELILNRYAK